MSDILKSVKRELEKKRCKLHGKKADIKLSGDNLNMNCCCDKFRAELSKEMDKAVRKSTDEFMKKLFK
ncbi:MAG TPA: hypothetical protein VL022_04690 [Moheibacter sp.]|nr:hypothetical protein [Moheibacter sp.]